MSLSHAILGLLKQEPMTGYDLKTQCFDTSIAHFWSADQSQIYRTLEQMAEEGWVESDVEVQETRPNRKVYQITATGRKELSAWLKTPQSIPAYREPLLVQVFFADELSNEELVAMFDAHLARHRARLGDYLDVPLPPIGTQGMKRKETLERLTLELGLRIQEAYISWLELGRDVAAKLDD